MAWWVGGVAWWVGGGMSGMMNGADGNREKRRGRYAGRRRERLQSASLLTVELTFHLTVLTTCIW